MVNKEISRERILMVAAGIIMAAVFLIPVFSGKYQALIAAAVTANPMYAFFIVAFARFLAIVVAPLPGQPVAFMSMAVMPWWHAWAANFIGADMGAVVAFLIARKFREPVAERFTGLHDLHKFEAALSGRTRFWGFLGLRFVAAGALDFFSYAAGLTKISFRVFLLATVLADIPISLAFFYFGGMAAQYGVYIMIVFIALFMVASAVMSRYFIKKNEHGKQ
ncbi:MAG: VTT domain-containing protein [bacterium]|nr:VTT domain-containing protein [bacterium]